ncbi:7-cyano-7-deazaguanine synthase [Trueperella pyogenes]|uniref:7-cyano-7-deazaguanine synthase n=1 Tax=Trueperella pyogenes TaxID=1661 RepID=UPI003132D47A
MSFMRRNVALLFSGGPDSTTLLYDLARDGYFVHALHFNFGEKSTKSVHQIAEDLSDHVELHEFNFTQLMQDFYGSPQPILMRKGLVINEHPETAEYVQPFGSAIALMLTASWAVKNDIRDVYYGVHYNDSHFVDNKKEYFDLLSSVTEACEGAGYRVSFHTPYLQLMKSEVIEKGKALGVDYAKTWSCADNTDVHCGVCPPCIDRRMSFSIASIDDPVHYLTDAVSTDK